MFIMAVQNTVNLDLVCEYSMRAERTYIYCKASNINLAEKPAYLNKLKPAWQHKNSLFGTDEEVHVNHSIQS